jgi:LacI family transcriptional regulator
VVLLAGSGRSRLAHTVRVDNASAMAAVANHLVGVHGLRRLAFMSGRAVSPDSSSRAESLTRAAHERGATVEPLDAWAADWTSGGAARTTRARLDRNGQLPQAIVCANDQMAIGAMHALTAAGLTIPGDVAVVGFDDISVARHLSPPLTTVRQPSRQLGAVAVEVLVDVVTGRSPASRETVLPTELVVRASCGCRPPHPDPDAWTIEP